MTNPDYIARTAPHVVAYFDGSDTETVLHDPYRLKWASTRGNHQLVTYNNRYGVKIVADLYSPRLPFRDPVTGVGDEWPVPQGLCWCRAAGAGRILTRGSRSRSPRPATSCWRSTRRARAAQRSGRAVRIALPVRGSNRKRRALSSRVPVPACRRLSEGRIPSCRWSICWRRHHSAPTRT